MQIRCGWWLTVFKWVFIVNVPDRKRGVVENYSGHVDMGKGGSGHTRSVEYDNGSAAHVVNACNIHAHSLYYLICTNYLHVLLPAAL